MTCFGRGLPAEDALPRAHKKAFQNVLEGFFVCAEALGRSNTAYF